MRPDYCRNLGRSQTAETITRAAFAKIDRPKITKASPQASPPFPLRMGFPFLTAADCCPLLPGRVCASAARVPPL